MRRIRIRLPQFPPRTVLYIYMCVCTMYPIILFFQIRILSQTYVMYIARENRRSFDSFSVCHTIGKNDFRETTTSRTVHATGIIYGRRRWWWYFRPQLTEQNFGTAKVIEKITKYCFDYLRRAIYMYIYIFKSRSFLFVRE